MKLILGSNSPRRKELLAGLDMEFTVDTGNNFEEIVPEGMRAEKVPLYFAEGKSDGFHRPLEEDEILLTADTVVLIPGEKEPLGKPDGRAGAVDMLSRLSGKTHKVITGVCLRSKTRKTIFEDVTEVHFTDLTPQQIDYYVDNYHPFDKAGAYGIQEWIGYAAIDKINGSFYNVMGLPVHKVYEEIAKFVD